MKLQHLFCALLCVFFVSCGEGDCNVTGIAIQPQNATADHNAASPGNTAQFFAHAVVHGACSTTQTAVMLQPDWSASDAVNVTISSGKDATNGTATCLNATAAPVTVTATVAMSSTQTFTAAAKLRCN